jgi:hypothetical protein
MLAFASAAAASAKVRTTGALNAVRSSVADATRARKGGVARAAVVGLLRCEHATPVQELNGLGLRNPLIPERL